eukprot:3977975-Prymnesium_polylepis.1
MHGQGHGRSSRKRARQAAGSQACGPLPYVARVGSERSITVALVGPHASMPDDVRLSLSDLSRIACCVFAIQYAGCVLHAPSRRRYSGILLVLGAERQPTHGGARARLATRWPVDRAPVRRGWGVLEVKNQVKRPIQERH